MSNVVLRTETLVVVSIDATRFDGAAGAAFLSAVKGYVADGVQIVVAKMSPSVTLDYEGARALGAAALRLGEGRLRVACLPPRASALLRTLRLTDIIALYEWWSDAADLGDRAAA